MRLLRILWALSRKNCLETAYKEYEPWDSLMMLTLVMELEAEYDASIPMEKLGDVKTLGDLYALIA